MHRKQLSANGGKNRITTGSSIQGRGNFTSEILFHCLVIVHIKSLFTLIKLDGGDLKEDVYQKCDHKLVLGHRFFFTLLRP